jgi:hypothetical protein
MHTITAVSPQQVASRIVAGKDLVTQKEVGANERAMEALLVLTPLALGRAARLAEAAESGAVRAPAAGATRAAAEVAGTVQGRGQLHHAKSRKISEALEEHRNLQGIYQARDPRFVLRAADEAAHRGYQAWHRQVDDEVVKWLEANREATAAEFEKYLREIYGRPEMRRRFPGGFEP